MNNFTTIIDTDWIDFLDTGEPENFLGRVWKTSEEYSALLLALLPEKSESDLELDRQDFLQDQEKMKQDNRTKEVLEFAQWSMYGNYEQIFLYRSSDTEWGRELVQDAWNALWEALSRLSDEEKEIAIGHCRSMCLSVEEDYPDADFYKWAKNFFEGFDFYAGVPSIPSQYAPGESLIKNRIVRSWTDLWIEGTQC